MNTRIELEVSDDGLYYADGSRRFSRIASANGYQGRLTVYAPATDTPIMSPAEDQSRMPIRGDASPADAMAELQRHLLNRADVIDIAEGQDAVDQRTRSARAYKIRVRGLGWVFAVKPEAMRDWIPGWTTMGDFLAVLDDRGWLIRGRDGNATRQVAILGMGRLRFYCLKLQSAADWREPVGAGTPSRIRDEDKEQLYGPARSLKPNGDQRQGDSPYHSIGLHLSRIRVPGDPTDFDPFSLEAWHPNRRRDGMLNAGFSSAIAELGGVDESATTWPENMDRCCRVRDSTRCSKRDSDPGADPFRSSTSRLWQPIPVEAAKCPRIDSPPFR